MTPQTGAAPRPEPKGCTTHADQSAPQTYPKGATGG
jgi:hypothetical protein